MRNIISVLVVSLVLGGCFLDIIERKMHATQNKQDCIGYGFQEGTQDYKECILTLIELTDSTNIQVINKQ